MFANTTGGDSDSDGTPDYEDITLKNISNDESFTIRVFEVKIPTSYYLIDKAGKIILGPQESTSSELTVPDNWYSPLVKTYRYWKIGAFNPEGIASGTYELIDNPDSYKINVLSDLSTGEHIYVTYDVDPDFIFDTTDDDKTGDQAYMLRFTGGETFRQENGKDALMSEDKAQKAVYPYSNGDAMLYVYGSEQWTTQLSSGASTRSRWLWYVVSPTSDPYHVKIMSHQGQASSHSYFRTYPVTYYDNATSTNVTKVVTGVTTKNTDAASEPATEYMILGRKSGSDVFYKLVTVDNLTDDAGTQTRTVNSFEQYWKNNPTIQNILKEGTDIRVTSFETYSDDITLNASQLDKLKTKLETALFNKWHSYKAFANAAPWVGWKTDSVGTDKKYKSKTHWFQTIDMGSSGEFVFEPVTLQPHVILIDNHGWEVMRIPMYTDKNMTVTNPDLKKYNSPMV